MSLLSHPLTCLTCYVSHLCTLKQSKEHYNSIIKPLRYKAPQIDENLNIVKYVQLFQSSLNTQNNGKYNLDS